MHMVNEKLASFEIMLDKIERYVKTKDNVASEDEEKDQEDQ